MTKIDLGLVKGPKGDKGEQGGIGPRGEQGVQGVPGTDATINGYNTATITASGNVELSQTEGDMTIKTTGALDAAVKWHNNKNLLDNWYFVGGGSQQGGGQFPINQRGKTEYAMQGYTIDRWWSNIDNDNKLVLTEYGLKMGGVKGLWQRFDSDPGNGQQMTLSVLLSDNTLFSATGKIPSEDNSKTDILDGHIYFRFGHRAGFYYIEFWDQTTIDDVPRENIFVAAKLELGDTQTLAHKEGDVWVLNEVPDYTTELLKCQRYLQPLLSDRVDIFRPGYILPDNFSAPTKWGLVTYETLSPPMRSVPTVVNLCTPSSKFPLGIRINANREDNNKNQNAPVSEIQIVNPTNYSLNMVYYTTTDMSYFSHKIGEVDAAAAGGTNGVLLLSSEL